MRVTQSRASFISICLLSLALSASVPLLSAETREPLIDNAKVRVSRVTVQPGETVRIDDPKLDRVIVWLQQGSGESISAGGHPASISWKQNQAAWEPAGSSRRIKFGGNAPVASVVIELKSKGNRQKAPTSPQNPWIVDPKHYKIDFENENVRVTRVNIGPKQSTPLHEHSLNRVVVYLTPMNFQIDPEGKQSERSIQNAGAVVWGLPVRHTEHNLSNQAFEAIVIEPKY